MEPISIDPRVRKQRDFSRLVTQLVSRAEELGYEAILLEMGPEWVAAGPAVFGQKNGKTVPLRYGARVKLFKENEQVHAKQAYEPLGIWWKAQGGYWDGDVRPEMFMR